MSDAREESVAVLRARHDALRDLLDRNGELLELLAEIQLDLRLLVPGNPVVRARTLQLLEATLLHEIGHVAGLGHATDVYSNMGVGHKFVTLGRRLNTYIQFRNVNEEYRDHREAFLIADKQALMYRAEARRWEGVADTYEPAVARRYLGLFDEIWDASAYQQELRELRV